MKWSIPTVALACLLAASAASAEVQVTMHDGRVSIVAKDATLRQIMTEWARVGQTKVVNVERIPGGPLTLELRDVTEDQALDVLMRPLSGYLAAPRAAAAPNLSKFDRILVMPTLAAARQATAVASAPSPQPAPFAPPASAFQSPQADDNDGAPVELTGAARPPVFTAFPQPQVVNPNAAQQQQQYPFTPNVVVPNGAAPAQTTAPGAVPTAPVGVSVPGMMVPAPQQPGQPQQGAVPIRRPGGL